MSRIQLKSDYPHNHISVPCVFIDTCMTNANGEFVKVYLYLLRCMEFSHTECSISAIADHFNHTEKDILRALKYWEKVGVLHLELDENEQLTGLVFCDLPDEVQPEAEPLTVPAALSVPAAEPAVAPKRSADVKTTDNKTHMLSSVPAKREYTLDEVKAFHNNHEVSELLFIIETYLKHTLSPTEMNTVFFWYDSLKFPGELIEYLVEYCISNGHSNLRYMDKVALSWAEDNIDTIEKAKEQISIRSKAYYSIMKAFGIHGRALADSENAFVNKWSKEYSFDIDLIQEACKRTISAIQKPSFEYADSILSNWHQHQVHTMKDVEALDTIFNKTKRTAKPVSPATAAAKRNKFNNFQQRSYDFNELEKLLLTTSVQ